MEQAIPHVQKGVVPDIIVVVVVVVLRWGGGVRVQVVGDVTHPGVYNNSVPKEMSEHGREGKEFLSLNKRELLSQLKHGEGAVPVSIFNFLPIFVFCYSSFNFVYFAVLIWVFNALFFFGQLVNRCLYLSIFLCSCYFCRFQMDQLVSTATPSTRLCVCSFFSFSPKAMQYLGFHWFRTACKGNSKDINMSWDKYRMVKTDGSIFERTEIRPNRFVVYLDIADK